MSYFDTQDEKVKELHKVYSEKCPDFIKEIIDYPELIRLNGVDINSGINLSGFNLYKYKYSVLDHSLGVALILNNFITNKNKLLAALFHDISVPAFSYATTYIDESNFEKDETVLTNYDVIVGSDKLFGYLFDNGINIDELCDYTDFPLGYNIRPTLCVHTLEYFLHTAYMSEMCTLEEIKAIYNDLVVVPNDDNMPELCFNDLELATKFFKISLECGEKYRSYESKMAMKFIADTLAAMVRRGVIKRKDLYTLQDKVIMDIGLNCSDKRISDRWRYLPNLRRVYTKFNKVEKKYCTKIARDLRYVDPLVKINRRYIRLSKINPDVSKKINEFLDSDTDLYMYIDYED